MTKCLTFQSFSTVVIQTSAFNIPIDKTKCLSVFYTYLDEQIAI